MCRFDIGDVIKSIGIHSRSIGIQHLEIIGEMLLDSTYLHLKKKYMSALED
jgi:hypothetical protein